MTADTRKTAAIIQGLHDQDQRAIARAITVVENGGHGFEEIMSSLDGEMIARALVLGITGAPGAGKSTLTSKLIDGYRQARKRVGVIAIDPSSPISGGAFLGDRIRMMGHASDNDVVVRSMATRGRLGGLCAAAGAAADIMAAAGCSVVMIETVGVGQSELDIVQLADLTLLVMAPGLGDEIQAMKAGLLEVADLIVVNKADLNGAETLTMDMEALGRDQARGGKRPQVLKTVAPTGQGVDELMAAITALDHLQRQEGTRRRRREERLRREVLDWAMELVRDRLAEKISGADLGPGTPRLIAGKIVENCLKNLNR